MIIACIYLIIGCTLSIWVTANNKSNPPKYDGWLLIAYLLVMLVVSPILVPIIAIKLYKERKT